MSKAIQSSLNLELVGVVTGTAVCAFEACHNQGETSAKQTRVRMHLNLDLLTRHGAFTVILFPTPLSASVTIPRNPRSRGSAQ